MLLLYAVQKFKMIGQLKRMSYPHFPGKSLLKELSHFDAMHLPFELR